MSPDDARATDHLTEDDIAALIEAELGGQQIVRDVGLLAVALARPQATAFGEPAYTTKEAWISFVSARRMRRYR